MSNSLAATILNNPKYNNVNTMTEQGDSRGMSLHLIADMYCMMQDDLSLHYFVQEKIQFFTATIKNDLKLLLILVVVKPLEHMVSEKMKGRSIHACRKLTKN